MFTISTKQATAILALLTTSVRGHMILGSPVPFDFADPTTQQSPLAADGSDFPCKFPSGFEPEQHSENAPMAPGSSNELSFIGGATHGGGSCQVSLTTDTVPTKDTKWEVIHSIEGGCPSDAEGNLSDDAQDTSSAVFSYTIPEDMEPGKYTLAWTWFNKIGNREMYMNCAPIEVASGGAKKRHLPKIQKKRQSSRPEIMIANIGNGCTTSEGTDVEFPSPGDSLEKSDGASLGAPVGECGASSASSDSASTDSDDADSGDADSDDGDSDDADSDDGDSDDGDSGDADSDDADSGDADSGDTDSGDADSDDADSGSDADSDAETGPEDASADEDTSATETESEEPVGSSASGTTAGSGAACSNEGAWICAPDGTSFTRCASGVMSAPMPLNNGMKCVPGESDNLDMVPEKRWLHRGVGRFARPAA